MTIDKTAQTVVKSTHKAAAVREHYRCPEKELFTWVGLGSFHISIIVSDRFLDVKH